MKVTVDGWEGVWEVCTDQARSPGMHDFTRVQRQVRHFHLGADKRKHADYFTLVRLAPKPAIREWKEPIDPTIPRS